MERTRAILHGSKLPLKLWAEIMETVRYLYTLGPVRYMNKHTPETIFRGLKGKPSIEHLRVIGCTVYSHNNNQSHSKLDARSKKGILIGYGDDRKAYKIWDPETDKTYHSRDVTFDEDNIGLSSFNS